MKHLFSTAALGLAAAIGAAPLHAYAADASASVTVELRDIKIELIDLTPDDGNTPWIQYTKQSFYGFVVGGDPFEMKANDFAGEVSIGGNGNSATAGSVIDRVWNHQQLVSGAFFTTYSNLDIGFTVSPWTSVRFSALGRIDGSRSGDASFQGSISLSRGLDVETRHSYYMPGLNETGEWLITTLVSSGATELGGSLRASIDASTTLPQEPGPAPVPEPSTYAMLLAGLGIIGAAARRKARQARG